MGSFSYFKSFLLIRITPIKPPGGESHLVVGEKSDSESGDDASSSSADMKASCRVTQPPGGSSAKIFSAGDDKQAVVKPIKPYRYERTYIYILHLYVY